MMQELCAAKLGGRSAERYADKSEQKRFFHGRSILQLKYIGYIGHASRDAGKEYEAPPSIY
jgi:hypothetical protein